jgi:hypothetical protein
VNVVKKLDNEWQTYRTRFLVRAKQLTAPLHFSDSLGREHCGLPGDYLVEFAGGTLRIAPRELFEDIYVPLEPVRKKRPYSSVSDRNLNYVAMRTNTLSS